MEDLGGGLEVLTRRPTLSTDLDPLDSPETDPPTKDHIWVGSRPLTHM